MPYLDFIPEGHDKGANSDSGYVDFIPERPISEVKQEVRASNSPSIPEQYQAMTTKELQKIAKERGLKATGSKKDLVQRLVDALLPPLPPVEAEQPKTEEETPEQDSSTESAPLVPVATPGEEAPVDTV